MLIHKINKRRNYIDFELRNKYFDLKSTIGTKGFQVSFYNFDNYSNLKDWTIVQIKTVNSKLLRTMYDGNV